MLQPGDEIDIWVIEKRLGSGGMGSVYRCHNRSARRILAAIKVLEGAIARHPEARARFVREAEILFTIDHPNVVKVRNIRVEGDTPYIEMQFVEGRSLEDTLASDGGIELTAALPLMQQIASAVAYLHRQGVRHRDMKPANLLITPGGSMKLVDFGLAMEAGGSRLTQGNASFGTVSYAPPEWVDPNTLDPVQWDLYGMGVVFWEMLTGAVAFPVSGTGSARQQAMQVILNKQNHPPLDPGPAYPMPLRELIGALTRSAPSERLTHATQALDQLNALCDNPLEEVRPLRNLRTLTPELHKRAADPTIVPRDPGHTFALDDAERATLDAPTDIREISPLPAPPSSNVHSAETLLEAEIEPRRGGGGGLRVALAVVLLLGLMSVLAGGIATAIVVLWPAPPPILRDASVILQGVPDGTPVSLALDEKAVLSGDGLTRTLPGLSMGEHVLQWAVGDGCDAEVCVTACPEWCLTGRASVEMKPGQGAQSLSLQVALPQARAIRVGTSAMPDNTDIDIVLDGVDGAMDGSVYRASTVRPGRYQATVTAGTCGASQGPCEDDCPDGCRKVARTVTVAVGSGRFESRIQIRPPTRVKIDKPVVRPPDVTTPKVPVVSGSAPLVTATRYADWLGSHPEWSRGKAIENQTADGNYLSKWVGDQPPAGKGGQPVEEVSFMAARAFCKGRGGLASITDEPTSWDDQSGLWFELREQGGKPKLMSSSGDTNTPVGRKQALVGTGFRCTK